MVQHSLRLGIRRVMKLKSSIEQKSVYLIGADPPADIVRRFEDSDVESVNRAFACGGQSRNACANDDDVMCHGLVALEGLRDGGVHEGVLEPESRFDQRHGHHP